MEGIRNLIFKYLDGELEEKDAGALLDWVRESPEHKETLFSFKEAYLALNYEKDRRRAQPLKEWKKLHAKVMAQDGTTRKRTVRVVIGIAASLVAGLLGGWFVNRIAEQPRTEMASVSTGIGQRAETILPDGSKVTLDPCSRLTYSFSLAGWKRRRDVSLQGEGTFEVVKDPDRPFTVGAPGFSVEVLGTEFKVSSYGEEKESTVTLKSGKVRMLFQDGVLALAPGESCIFDNETKSYRLAKASENDLLDWKGSELRFEGQELSEMTGRLYRHFGYTFVLSDEVKKKVYKATIRDESLHDFLLILETVTPQLVSRIDKESRTVYLSL